ncbi:hypothetical protein [Streptomyces sp. NPDC049813]|uniref:hypothetical protein n=1 Tax=Streptomyces sp. NPDC049813 TaxID=3365597 RepID=UPI0037A46853
MSTKTRQRQAALRARSNRPQDKPAGAAVVRALRAVRRRHLAWAAGACALVAAVVTAFALFGGGDDRPPVPDTRARHYTETDACLLTDGSGITAGSRGATVWQGMQDASATTHARVSYTPVTGEQTVGSATPFLNGQLQRSCEVVVASGGAERAAARLAAPAHRTVRFLLVGGAPAEGDGGNITVVGAERAAVARAVRAAATS